MTENPWHNLPAAQPFVLKIDEEKVVAFNEKQSTKPHRNHFLHLDLIPEPFVGRPDAPVVLLGNNPGVANKEPPPYRKEPAFINRMRNNLKHQLSDDFPFLYFDPEIIPPDRKWWQNKMKDLIKAFGIKGMAKSILAVEFFPYASHRYGQGRLSLPSQEYSFQLVRKAMKRNAVIVLTRGNKRWKKQIEGLEKYDHLVRLKSPYKAPISPNNCRDGGYQKVFDKIKEALQ
jgi:hypothetical protein